MLEPERVGVRVHTWNRIKPLTLAFVQVERFRPELAESADIDRWAETPNGWMRTDYCDGSRDIARTFEAYFRAGFVARIIFSDYYRPAMFAVGLRHYQGGLSGEFLTMPGAAHFDPLDAVSVEWDSIASVSFVRNDFLDGNLPR